MVGIMSEETARELETLRQAEAERRSGVDRLKQQFLEGIAQNLPGRLDDYAKKLSQAQPDHARALGPDGINALREELAEAADQLATELRGALGEIPWPGADAVRSSADVHSALFGYLYPGRVNSLTAIFKNRGFYFHSTEGVLPQNLYDMHGFGELVLHSSALAEAERRTAAAKAADDHDEVESLWGGEQG